jgi:hypothetical protein
MANVNVELKCEGGAFRGFPPQLPNTTIHAFRVGVQPTLDMNPVWAGLMFWFVIPRRGGTPMPVENWDAPLSAHAHPTTNVVSFHTATANNVNAFCWGRGGAGCWLVSC